MSDVKREKKPARWSPLLANLIPGCLGLFMYLINGLDVIHGLLAAPSGYTALGLQRTQDIAMYLTWLQGLKQGWLMPNYHAPWSTSAQFIPIALIPVSIMQRLLSLSPVLSLQIFSLAGYIFTAYALAFGYKTFCKTGRQTLLSVTIAFCCVPVAALPIVSHLFRNNSIYGDAIGRVQFMFISDGFLRALVAAPFITFGTGFQVLSIALLARYVNSGERRWVAWLALTCLLSALVHPFEIFVTLVVVGVVLVREFGPTARNLTDLTGVFAAGCVGLSPYVIQSLRVPWVREMARANVVDIAPSSVLAMVGLPSVLVIVLLLLGFPRDESREVLILKVWFISTLLLFFVPGMPFPIHFLDGLFVAVGLLLTVQIRDLSDRWPVLVGGGVRVVAGVLVLVSVVPHVRFRLQSWSSGIAVGKEKLQYPSTVSPVGETATVKWLREHARPDDLVLAPEDSAPWVATAPVHSFASHWLCSLPKTLPRHGSLRNSFFEGTLTPVQAHDFVETLGFRFVVVPDETRAGQYLGDAILRARFNTWAIYEVPGAHMKPYHDSRILALGVSPLEVVN